MKMKIDGKKLGLTTLLGTAVVVGTPLIYGVLVGFGPVAQYITFDIIPNMLDVGTVIAAGLSAFLADLAITQWLE